MDSFINFINFILSYHGDIPLNHFARLYGVHLFTACLLFHFASSLFSNITPVYLLMFLDWIRNYPTVAQILEKWKCDPKTF
jgi:hypothetical protein